MIQPAPSALSAVIYVRVSSAPQADGFSLDDQISACLKRCDDKGWQVGGIYRDELPGGFRDRPALKAALAALTPGKSVFVTWSVERFGRDHAYSWECVRQIREERRCAFSSVTEDIDLDTVSGRLLFGVKGLIAQFSNESRAEDVRRSIHGLAERGRFAGGRAAYGYHMKHLGKKQGCTLEVVEEQAEVVKMMFGWVDAEGVGAREIARRLNDMAIPSPRGKQWRSTAVRGVLYNPAYAGMRAIRARAGRRFSPRGFKINEALPRDQWREFPGEHPGIIAPAQFARVRETLDGRHCMARPPRYDYLLTGLLRCACGATMSAHASQHAGRQYPRYACSRQLHRLLPACRNPSVWQSSWRPPWLRPCAPTR